MRYLTSLCILLCGLSLKAQNVTLIQDVNTRMQEYNAKEFCEFNNTLYFSAASDVYGEELYNYDPSQPAGSEISISGIPTTDPTLGNPKFMTVYNGSMYMNYTEAGTGAELFILNGNAPMLVSDMTPGNSSSAPNHFFVYGAYLYFTASVSGNRELYRYDGNTISSPITSFTTGNLGFDAFTNSEFEVVNDTLYFSVRTTSSDYELYKYDGSAPPILIHSSLSGSYSNLTAFNDTLYLVWEEGSVGSELFKFGNNGMTLVFEASPGINDSYTNNLTVVNDTLYFTGLDWVSFDSHAFYCTSTESFGTVSNVYSPYALTNFNNQLVCRGNDLTFGGIFIVENASATMMYNLNTGDYNFNGLPYYFEFQNELYSPGGSKPGEYVERAVVKFESNYDITLVDAFKNIQTTTNSNTTTYVDYSYLATNDGLYYSGTSNEGNMELYRATTDSVIKLSDHNYGALNELIEVNNSVYFTHGNSFGGGQAGITRFDGTQFNQEAVLQFQPQSLIEYNNEIYFYGYAGASFGSELCKLDNGSSVMIEDLEPGSGSSSIIHPIEFDNKFLFYTYSGTYTNRWHYYDGTSITTIPGTNFESARNPLIHKNKMYFIASESQNLVNFGRIWSLSDVSIAPEIQYPHITHIKEMLSVNDTLYFFGKSGGQEYLFREDLNSDLDSVSLNSLSNPAKLAILKNTIYFVAQGVYGRELYSTQMNTSPSLFEDIYPGTTGSIPGNLLVIEDTLFFHAEAELTGREMYYTLGCNLDVTITESNGVLDASSTSGDYQWIDCTTNQPISGATNPMFTPAAAGTYACLINQGSCSDLSNCITININDIEELGDHGIYVFPNPVNTILQIQTDAVVNGYEIIDSRGLILVQGSSNQIDISSLATGIYYLKVYQENTAKVVSFIKN